MTEFTVGEHAYRTDRKLDVFKQASIVRRIAPLFAGLAGSMGATAPSDVGAALLDNMTPIAEALAQMKDEDSDYLIKTCLSVVVRQMAGGTGWSRMLSTTGDLMFEDVDLIEVMQIVWRVLEESLAGFFQGLGTASSEAAQA